MWVWWVGARGRWRRAPGVLLRVKARSPPSRRARRRRPGRRSRPARPAARCRPSRRRSRSRRRRRPRPRPPGGRPGWRRSGRPACPSSLRSRPAWRRCRPSSAPTCCGHWPRPHRPAAGRPAVLPTVRATLRPAIGRPSPRTSPASYPAHSRPRHTLASCAWAARANRHAVAIPAVGRGSIQSKVAYHPAVERAGPTVDQHAADVSGALAPHTAELSSDIYELIVREIPRLRGDSRVLTLLEASVAENVATVLHILQHGIDLDRVHAPAAAEEYARRLAQRGSPMAALLRAYRLGSTRFQHWCLRELGRHTDDAAMISAAGLRIAETTAAYIDRVSEELVAAYEAEKESWLRNLSAARAARVRALLRGDRVDVDASEAVLGYHLRQYHVGAVCWLGDREAGGPALARLEHATMVVAAQAGCEGRPI